MYECSAFRDFEWHHSCWCVYSHCMHWGVYRRIVCAGRRDYPRRPSAIQVLGRGRHVWPQFTDNVASPVPHRWFTVCFPACIQQSHRRIVCSRFIRTPFELSWITRPIRFATRMQGCHGQGSGDSVACPDGDPYNGDFEAADDESCGAEQVCQDAPRRPQGLPGQLPCRLDWT